MKKMFLMLAVLALASVVYANVDITCAQIDDTNEVLVSYSADTVAETPRGMGLTINLNNGYTISKVTKLTDNKYWVYPGTIDVEGAQYNGDPVASGGVGASSMIIEMGSLHSPTTVGDVNGPNQIGSIIKFSVDPDSGAGVCTVTISGDSTRGNVVKYDATEATVDYSTCEIGFEPPPCLYVGQVFDLSGFVPSEPSLTVTQLMVDRWNHPNVNNASCWCCLAQKVGNAVYSGASGSRVDVSDLAALKLSWFKSHTQVGFNPCCDTNLSGRVDVTDLAMMKRHWFKSVGTCL